FTYAEFNYKQLAGNVVITGLEEIQNSGKEAVHNLLKSRIKNLEKSLKNEMATALYATGTGNDGKEIGGLRLLVADAGTGTVGGIDSSTWTFWQNFKYDFSDESVTAGVTTIQHAMNQVWVNIIRGADKPDMWVADTTYYLFYLESLQANQRFVDEKMAQAGFMNIMFMSSPVFFDDQCPSTHMYALNTDYLYLRPAKGREFVPLGEKASVNQDAMVMPVVWGGNLCTSNRSLQGVIVA
ncbi:MAG: phage major capsid protein, partial [Nitrososphaera sp.]|nr:phage major capsid protein [Nitrososphaera sp.]